MSQRNACNSLRLVKLQQQDLVFYLSIYTDPELMQFIGKIQSVEKLQRSFQLTLDYMSRQPPEMLLFVLRSLKGEAVGVGILNFRHQTERKAEIGVIICQQHQRQGYSYQAKRLLIAAAFEDFKATAVTAICQIDNAFANRANQKLGFRIEKTETDSKDKQTKNYWILEKR
ncbi:GNAT family N-acetyltransferase [Marinicella sp. W31]|uniref:GNAT family N-acetyltransferase n=1 Tax=Marinicella sp. W31 TaxID=3023713 RepID=UPI003756FD76